MNMVAARASRIPRRVLSGRARPSYSIFPMGSENSSFKEITESEDIECYWEFLGDCVGCSMYECMPAYTTTHGMIQSSSPEATK